MNWIDPPSDNYTILYEYTSGTRTLKRTESINGTVNSVIQIAENIAPSTSFTTNGSGYYILTVTANVSGYQPASETRTYEIKPRIAGY